MRQERKRRVSPAQYLKQIERYNYEVGRAFAPHFSMAVAQANARSAGYKQGWSDVEFVVMNDISGHAQKFRIDIDGKPFRYTTSGGTLYNVLKAENMFMSPMKQNSFSPKLSYADPVWNPPF